MEIAMVLHSRIKENAKEGEKYSEVMTEIANGARNWLITNHKEVRDVNLRVSSQKESYSSPEEFSALINDEVHMQNPDVIIMPFSLCLTDYEDDFFDLLRDFDGGVIAINVPPMRRVIKESNINYLGYVGGDEKTAGKRLADQIFSKKSDVKKIFVLNHKENHYGLKLRIDGIETRAYKNKALRDVEEICIDPESKYGNKDIEGVISLIKTKREMEEFENNFAIATLGVRGAEMAIEIKKKMGIDFPIVGMDINDNVRQAIKDGIVFSTLIQEPSPHQQGWQAVAMAVNYLKATIHEPKIISKDNIDSYK